MRIRETRRHRLRGFTMVEMAVVVSLVAVIIAVAVPAVRDVFIRGRLSSVTRDLMADLRTARSYAVSHKSIGGIVTRQSRVNITSDTTWDIEITSTPASSSAVPTWTVVASVDLMQQDASNEIVVAFPTPPATVTFADNGMTTAQSIILNDPRTHSRTIDITTVGLTRIADLSE